MLVVWLKKIDFNIKVIEIEGKIPDVSNLVKNTDLDTKLKKFFYRVTKNKSKHLLVENEIKKLKAFDTSYSLGKNYFEGNDETQNSLVFQVEEKYFKIILVVIDLKLKYGNQKVYVANH